MTITSKEHYDMIAMFEKTFKGSFRFDKEPKELWSKGRVYQDGSANTCFLAYRHGYSYGKMEAA